MKLRNFAIIFLIFLAASNTYAQKGGMISVGVTPGLSYMLAQNTYFLAENSKELDYKPKFSYHAFIQGAYNFKEQHGIVAYANFCDEGQKYKDEFKWKKYPALVGTHEKSVDFKYMGLGVLYRFAPLLKGQKEHIRIATDEFHWRMKLLVGFEADFLLNAQMKYKITPVGGKPTDVGYPILPSLGGYADYAPNPSNNYKTYFKGVQGVAVMRLGFDYIFNNNMFMGFALEMKAGLNDINAKAYRVHPEYKSSRNYFFGLNVEIGYSFQKDKRKVEAKKEAKPEKTKTPGIDMNKRTDDVDKATKKRLGK